MIFSVTLSFRRFPFLNLICKFDFFFSRIIGNNEILNLPIYYRKVRADYDSSLSGGLFNRYNNTLDMLTVDLFFFFKIYYNTKMKLSAFV